MKHAQPENANSAQLFQDLQKKDAQQTGVSHGRGFRNDPDALYGNESSPAVLVTSGKFDLNVVLRIPWTGVFSFTEEVEVSFETKLLCFIG